MVTVKAIVNYFDIEQKKEIIKGETFHVSTERAKVLTNANVCQIIKIEPEQKQKTKKK